MHRSAGSSFARLAIAVDLEHFLDVLRLVLVDLAAQRHEAAGAVVVVINKIPVDVLLGHWAARALNENSILSPVNVHREVFAMKLVISPPVSAERLQKIITAAAPMQVVNAQDEDHAARRNRGCRRHVRLSDAAAVASGEKAALAQSPTASMEKYLYPELVASSVIVTNMRGIFSDVIADHVFGYILMFAKNFHIYLRQQMRGEWHMLGRPAGANCRVTAGPARCIRPTRRR